MSSRSLRLPANPAGASSRRRAIDDIRYARPYWFNDALAVVGVLAVTALVAWDRIRFDEWLTRTDLLAAYVPFYAFLGEQLRSFDLPGWNPHQFAGITFVGDPQSGWMYFPAMFFFTILPPLTAMKALMAFQLAFAALSMYAFARVLGMGIAGSLAGTLVFAFGANVFHNTWCCTIWAQASTWVPLSLLGVELGLRKSTWSGRAVGWGLTGIGLSQILAGWLGQGAYNAFLLVGGYLAYRALISPPTGPTPFRDRLKLFLVSFVAIYGVGLGLAAAGLLPRFDANQYTNLAGGLYGNVERSNSSGWPWEAVVQRSFDARGTYLTRRYYVGGVAIALGMLAPFVARARYAVPFFALYTVTLLALVVDNFWLHRLFYLLPRYEELHEHTQFRVWGLLMIGPAVLAAATVDTLGRWSRKRWAILVAIAPLIIVQAVRVEMAERYEPVGRPSLYAAVAVTALLGVAAVIHWPRVRRSFPRAGQLEVAMPFLLVVAVLIEPTGRQVLEGGTTSVPTRPEEAAMIEVNVAETDPGGAGEFLQNQQELAGQPFRYFGYNGIRLRTEEQRRAETYHGRVMNPSIVALLVSARATRLGLEDVQGYNPIQSARYVSFLRAVNDGIAQDYHDGNILPAGLNSPLLDLLNVRYIVVPGTVPPGRPDLFHLWQRYPVVFVGDDLRVLERPSALPRAWIVHEARTVPDDAALAALAAGEVDPTQVALLAEELPALSAPANPAADAVTVEREDGNGLTLTTTTDAAGLLTLSEVYDPGWNAYVDGERVDLLRANYTFRAVPIPAGTHSVELRYEPESLRYGLAISIATALLLAAIFVAAIYRRFGRRARS
jgi:hypothetical protein